MSSLDIRVTKADATTRKSIRVIVSSVGGVPPI